MLTLLKVWYKEMFGPSKYDKLSDQEIKEKLSTIIREKNLRGGDYFLCRDLIQRELRKWDRADRRNAVFLLQNHN